MPMWCVAPLVMNEGNSLGQGYNRPTGCSAEKAPHMTFNFNFKLEGGRWVAHAHEQSVSHNAVNHISKLGHIIASTVTQLPRVGELSFKVWPFKCPCFVLSPEHC